jgi:hypothetical protein
MIWQSTIAHANSNCSSLPWRSGIHSRPRTVRSFPKALARKAQNWKLAEVTSNGVPRERAMKSVNHAGSKASEQAQSPSCSPVTSRSRSYSLIVGSVRSAVAIHGERDSLQSDCTQPHDPQFAAQIQNFQVIQRSAVSLSRVRPFFEKIRPRSPSRTLWKAGQFRADRNSQKATSSRSDSILISSILSLPIP